MNKTDVHKNLKIAEKFFKLEIIFFLALQSVYSKTLITHSFVKSLSLKEKSYTLESGAIA